VSGTVISPPMICCFSESCAETISARIVSALLFE
jgi:hypothetical protein